MQLFRQRVDHRDAHAVQTTRHLVGVAVELTAGVQHRHDDLGGGAPFIWMDVHRDTPAVIAYRDRAVGMDGDLDFAAVTGQGFIDGIIDHLEHHMMQAGPVIRIPDIHTGTLAYGIKPL